MLSRGQHHSGRQKGTHTTGLHGLSAAPGPNLGATHQFQTLVIYWGGEKELLCTPIPEGLLPKERELHFLKGDGELLGPLGGYFFNVQERNNVPW